MKSLICESFRKDELASFRPFYVQVMQEEVDLVIRRALRVRVAALEVVLRLGDLGIGRDDGRRGLELTLDVGSLRERRLVAGIIVVVLQRVGSGGMPPASLHAGYPRDRRCRSRRRGRSPRRRCRGRRRGRSRRLRRFGRGLELALDVKAAGSLCEWVLGITVALKCVAPGGVSPASLSRRRRRRRGGPRRVRSAGVERHVHVITVVVSHGEGLHCSVAKRSRNTKSAEQWLLYTP